MDGRRGIETYTGLNPFFKIALKVFLYALNWFFFINSFFLIQYIVVYNRNKIAPGDHESNFKKVGSIPCGFYTIKPLYVVEI